MATVVEVARALNVTPQRVHQLVNEGMPREARGEYSLGGCMAWYIRHLQAAVERKHDPERRGDVVAFVRQRRRLTHEQADGIAMRNRVDRGDLVHVGAVAREFTGAVTVIADFARTLPARLAPALEGLTVTERQAVLTVAMHELLDYGLTHGARRSH
jgi:phage terminase Nu1 subunit (DNA packaging protein)